MDMTPEEVSKIDHDEGIIVGSVLIKGGKESLWDKIPVLGLESRTWNLTVQKMDSSQTFSIDAEERAEEAVFVTKMPAGEYRFVRLDQQTGNRTLYADIDVPFTVQASKTVYIGRLVIEFPLEQIRGGFWGTGTKFSYRVEDVKKETLASVENTYGDVARDAVTDLMGKYHLEIPQTFEQVWYRPAKRGLALVAYSHSGSLIVGEEAIEFSCKEKQMTIPYNSILDVRWGKLGLDTFNEWAIVKFSIGESEEVAAFKDGKQIGHGQYSRKIYKAIEKAFSDYDASNRKMLASTEPENQRPLPVKETETTPETSKTEAEKPLLEKEKPKVAAIPKEVPIRRVSLRKKPLEITEFTITNMLLEYDFFERSMNTKGSFVNDLVDNNDGTVIDKATGLMWQKSGSSKSLQNRDAKKYIKQLNRKRFAGHADWRMPTVEELASLMKKAKTKGVHMDPVFDHKRCLCWTIDKGDVKSPSYSRVWIINFKKGQILKADFSVKKGSHDMYFSAKNEINYVKAVRSVK
jgi:hypothetical protein